MSYAHEDYYESIELSNIHIKICVPDESSIELKIISAYANQINEFVKSIDNDAKVLIQFDEDNCYFNNDYYHILFKNFHDALIPQGFPFGYDYDLGFLKSEQGLVINTSHRHFKLGPILKLIEFGLQNKNRIIRNQSIMIDRIKSLNLDSIGANRTRYSQGEINREICTGLTDSIINSKPSELIKKVLIQRIVLQEIFKTIILKNDSIHLLDGKLNTILSISSLHSLFKVNDGAIFVFNTNESFYFINEMLTCNGIENKLPFKIDCLEYKNVIFVDNLNGYKITVSDWYAFPNNVTKEMLFNPIKIDWYK